MTLRLVLVSLVAALGLSLPSAAMIESWVASTQNWMNARFADWDTRNPPSADYVIVSDFYDPVLADFRTGSPAAPAPVQTSQMTGAALTVDASVPAVGARTLDTAGRRERGASSVRTVSFVRQARTFSPLEVSPLVRRNIADELNRLGEGLGLAMPRVTPRPRFEPIEVASNPPRTIADELNAQQDGIGIRPPAPVARRAARLPFEPIEVAEVVQAGVAYELNRQAEGIGIRPPVLAPRLQAIATRPQPIVAAAPSLAALETEPNLYFAADLGPQETSIGRPAAPAVVQSKPLAVPATSAQAVSSRPGREPAAGALRSEEETEELVLEVANELVSADDGFGTWQELSRSGPAPRPVLTEGSLALVPASDQFFGCIAFELSRRSLSFHPVPARQAAMTAARVAKSAADAPDLSRAVRLTREAVYAWIHVLTGPAIVTVSQNP
jgi:hypothetical protein